MITNTNASKNPSTAEFVDIKKYQGVASISIVGINPSNERLCQFGWNIPEDAEEPKYVTVNSEGKKSARVRFLVKLEDFDDKPVIALDFWIRPDYWVNKKGDKAQIIDSYGRTAWGTKEEIKAHRIPQYASGPAQISPDYKMSHYGQEDLVGFIMKFLNMTPLSIFDRKKNDWVASKNPGRLTIDHWDKLCEGDVTEIAEYIAMQASNKVKVVLGIRTTDDNKAYQTFLPGCYIGNGALPDRQTGEYTTARKAIDRARNDAEENDYPFPYLYAATPVREWGVEATQVTDNSEETPVEATSASDPAFFQPQDDDLPFGPEGGYADPNTAF